MASRGGGASKLASADAIADEMTTAIVRDLGEPAAAAEVLLLVNGFGGTPLDGALSHVQCRATWRWRSAACAIARSLVGSFVTSLEMAGCSITVTLLDPRDDRALGSSGSHRGAAMVNEGTTALRSE